MPSPNCGGCETDLNGLPTGVFVSLTDTSTETTRKACELSPAMPNRGMVETDGIAPSGGTYNTSTMLSPDCRSFPAVSTSIHLWQTKSSVLADFSVWPLSGWSGQRESDPHSRLGRPMYYPLYDIRIYPRSGRIFTIPAHLRAYRRGIRLVRRCER